MKFRNILLFSFIVLIVSGCNDRQSASDENVSGKISQLMEAMIAKDEKKLSELTSDDLVYGHSGGKVQNKAEFIAEIRSGQPIEYVDIELIDQTIKEVNNTAIVRHIFTAKTSSNGKAGNLRIGNVLIWQSDKGTWKLLARQAYRLPD